MARRASNSRCRLGDLDGSNLARMGSVNSNMKHVPPASIAVLVVLTMGCSQEPTNAIRSVRRPNSTTQSSRPQPVKVTKFGACGGALLWAQSPSGETAITVTAIAGRRSGDIPARIPIAIPDPEVTVEVLKGHKLATNFCTDVIVGSSMPTSRVAAVAGSGEIVLTPTQPAGASCSRAQGTLRLDGLVGADGTVFAPIAFTASGIGCSSG